MTIRVRPAQPADADALARIGASTFALACPPSTPAADLEAYIRSELTPQRFREYLASPASTLFAAEVDGAVAGYLMLSGEPAPQAVAAERPLQIQRLYVLQQFHGAAIGLLLMGQALEQARDGGHDGLWLSVSKHNRRGIAFYRKTGFAVVGEQTFPVGKDLHEDFIMARRVP
jgi:diamine N-acetyltransferase